MGEPQPGTGIAAAGIAAFAVVCCAGAPLVLGVLSGVALGALLGGAVGVVAFVAVAVARVRLVRRGRSCDPVTRGGSGEGRR